MFKHTITRVRPSTDVKWFHETPDFSENIDDSVYTVMDMYRLEQRPSSDRLTLVTERYFKSEEWALRYKEVFEGSMTEGLKKISDYYKDVGVTITHTVTET